MPVIDREEELQARDTSTLRQRAKTLLAAMTLEEKIGQLTIVNAPEGDLGANFIDDLARGHIGAVINEVRRDRVEHLQHLAMQGSRHGIPLLVGRDVIHGFKTILPIPIAQASSWNEELVEACARVAAVEAAGAGINWTYAPMMDICRDPRWGRIAESLGEDPWLTSRLASAMIRGFQTEDLARPDALAACAKHFAGYGASEGGRDYNTTNIPENELRNVHLPPFRAAVEAGAASIMTSFSDLDGVPASANEFLLRRILRDEWGYEGLVVSDWDSIGQLVVHGFAENEREAAKQAANAGVDMEMTSRSYINHLAGLVEKGAVPLERIDEMALHVLETKLKLGLFEQPVASLSGDALQAGEKHLATARRAALESCVLLKNSGGLLPLEAKAGLSVAVIGPLADDGYEQLGTWVFDGDPALSTTPLQALKQKYGETLAIHHLPTLKTTRDRSMDHFEEACSLAEESDVVLLFLGEESILSGEAHCRADITLPGSQEALIERIAAMDKPVVLVLMTGRPLALQSVVDKVDAILLAWHGGSMAGPAIVDLLFGDQAPSGRLPVTFPRVTGQVPIYYAHKNTGRPPTPETVRYIDEIEPRAPQHSFGNTSYHLDVETSPLFPFGFGLGYTEVRYDTPGVQPARVPLDGEIVFTVNVSNVGSRDTVETVQLYIRDLVGSVTRPVRELKGYRRVHLAPGETKEVRLALSTRDLAFYGRDNTLVTEPGRFQAFLGGSSDADLRVDFEVTGD